MQLVDAALSEHCICNEISSSVLMLWYLMGDGTEMNSMPTGRTQLFYLPCSGRCSPSTLQLVRIQGCFPSCRAVEYSEGTGEEARAEFV